MPFRQLKDTDLQYALISFDAQGREVTNDPAGGVLSRTVLQTAKTDKPTDVFLFSHGWQGDFPAAVDQYDRWIGAMWKLEEDRRAMGESFRPLFIGLHWPSLPWGEEGLPSAASFADAVVISALAELYEKTVEHFGDGPKVRQTLRTIFDAYESDPANTSLDDATLAAYHELAGAIGFSSGSDADAAPEEEGAPLDPEEAIRADRAVSMAAPFGGGGGLFKGVLGGLRQASFWIMKQRARSVGEKGMHMLVADVLRQTDARVHIMGHSFGCIVASSILGGSEGDDVLPRPVQSAALVQGAMSLWSWSSKVPGTSKPGYYHRLLANWAVAGPIVCTHSIHDTAVGLLYPAAVGLVREATFGADLPRYGAIGTFGLQGLGSAAEPIAMLASSGTYGFQAGRVYNVESSQFIDKMDGVAGAHSDIDGPEVAHAFWQAARPAGRGQQA